VGLTTLKRRAEFLRVRGGLRWSTSTLVVESKPRETNPTDSADPSSQSRFGFTVTKKLGKAVVRNRIRRRLKSAVRELSELARPGFDYVVIAREPAIERAYADLKSDLAQALTRIHRSGAGNRNRKA
jgi:ribonuclease P protein component